MISIDFSWKLTVVSEMLMKLFLYFACKQYANPFGNFSSGRKSYKIKCNAIQSIFTQKGYKKGNGCIKQILIMQISIHIVVMCEH